MFGSTETKNRMVLFMNTELNSASFTGKRHSYYLSHSPLPIKDVSRCKAPSVHALHYLLSAITCGKVTVEDLRRAFVAKKRRISAPSSNCSSLTDCSLEGKLQRTPIIQEGNRRTGEISQAVRNGDGAVAYCSCTDERASCNALANILQRCHRCCDKHGRMLYRGSLTGLFFRPLEAYCARKAVEDGPAMHPVASPAACLADMLLVDSVPTLHSCSGVSVRCDRKKRQWGGTHHVLYDEEKLLDSLQLLNISPSHVIHLCFWAASRMLLSQTFRGALDPSPVLLLLEAAVPSVRSGFGWQRAHSGERAGLHTTAGSLRVAEAERSAAMHYVKQAVAIPFLLWWNYLINELPDSEACNGQERRFTKQHGALTNGQLEYAGSVGNGGKPRTRSVLRSHSGRQSRVEAWQSLLSHIVSQSAASGLDASSLDASLGATTMPGESGLLCSLLFPGRLDGEPKERRRTTYRTPLECSKSVQSAECLSALASLLHVHEHLTIQFVFMGPTSFHRAAEHDGQVSFPDSCDKQGSVLERQVRSSPPAACVHVGHNDISAWLTWVLQRLVKLTASTSQ